MKKTSVLVLAATLFLISCGNETNESAAEKEEVKFDKTTAEYKTAELLCDCFETFNEDDPAGQMEAVGCLMEKMGNDASLQNADEEKTKEILKQLCPETAAKFDKWQDNMKNN